MSTVAISVGIARHQLRRIFTHHQRMFSSPNHSQKGAPSPLVDVHTHMYPPKYMEILRARGNIPKVVKNHQNEDRLVILPNEKVCEQTGNVGRPIGFEYFDAQEKLNFMDRHHISHSVVSVANPWLDFLGPNKTSKTGDGSYNVL